MSEVCSSASRICWILQVPIDAESAIAEEAHIPLTMGSRSNDGGNQRRARRRKEAREKGTGEAARGEETTDPVKATEKEIRKPSLIEQLFPEETKRRADAQRREIREIPRLPLDAVKQRTIGRGATRDNTADVAQSDAAQSLYKRMREQDDVAKETTVLVMRNASLNLVEEDFRRLIPQGKHLEGWTLEQGDILKIVPGRDLATLEQKNYYYLLFSSKLSAFTYQGHATRIFRMASAHTPSSMTSPIPPPPGLVIDGMDAHAAIEAFTLVPASQTLELRQLQPPLSPMLESIVRNQGYSSLVNRENKSPFEVRLTLDGPQLQASTIGFILHASGKYRAHSWSGGEEIIPKITKWEPRTTASPMDFRSQKAQKMVNERDEAEQMLHDAEKLWERRGLEGLAEPGQQQQPRRTPRLVHIVGFHTENAAQNFVSFWHRRRMAWKGVGSGRGEDEEDLPPITNVEMLW